MEFKGIVWSKRVFLQVMDIYLYIDIFFLEYERANFICVHIKYGFNQRGLWRNERETVKYDNEDIVKLREASY